MKVESWSEGARGRRFLLELAGRQSAAVWSTMLDTAWSLEGGDLTADVRALTAALDESPAAVNADDALVALDVTVQAATPVAGANGLDVVCRVPAVAAALSDYGARVDAHAPWAGWDGRHTPTQAVARFRNADGLLSDYPPFPAAHTVDEWQTAMRQEEAQAARRLSRRWRSPRSRAPSGGAWWSVPLGVASTSDVTDRGVVTALYTTVDSRGWSVATTHEVDERPRAVCEIASAHDWARLVEDAPVEVTHARAGTWGVAYASDRRWMIPDWQRVAQDWDAVHFPISGYLSAAGHEIRLDAERSTVIAGFSPGTTLWLRGTPALAPGDGVSWTRPRDEGPWIRQAASS